MLTTFFPHANCQLLIPVCTISSVITGNPKLNGKRQGGMWKGFSPYAWYATTTGSAWSEIKVSDAFKPLQPNKKQSDSVNGDYQKSGYSSCSTHCFTSARSLFQSRTWYKSRRGTKNVWLRTFVLRLLPDLLRETHPTVTAFPADMTAFLRYGLESWCLGDFLGRHFDISCL